MPIHELTIWEVTIWNDSQIAYRHSFLGPPDRYKVAEALRYRAARERIDATILTAEPKLLGSFMSETDNHEMVARCLEYADKLDELALKVDVGTAEVRFRSHSVIEVAK